MGEELTPMDEALKDAIRAEIPKIFRLGQFLIPEMRGAKDLKWDFCERAYEIVPKQWDENEHPINRDVTPETVIMLKWLLLTDDGSIRRVRMGYCKLNNTLYIREWSVRPLPDGFIVNPTQEAGQSSVSHPVDGELDSPDAE